MPLTIDWRAVLLRLGLALIAGAILGFNRGEHGHPAGLRTTILVCVAAAASMIQVNLLLELESQKQSLVSLDLMRLPLGILSGMGFIGGGAILKRGDIVHGVTTAATLWFVTVMGLCLGGGQIALGLELLAVGILVLWVLKRIEHRYVEDRRATLQVSVSETGPTEEELRSDLVAHSLQVIRCASDINALTRERTFEIDLRWRTPGARHGTPAVVDGLARATGVLRLKWDPKT
jgi:putative Mg2+ transporter-C (MgtC) family protein